MSHKETRLVDEPQSKYKMKKPNCRPKEPKNPVSVWIKSFRNKKNTVLKLSRRE